MELDKERLVKLLNLTASRHDGEALTAVRKANELLQQHKTSWLEVLGLEETAPEEAEPEPARREARPEPWPAHPRSSIWTEAASTIHRHVNDVPHGYAMARQYRDAFRREPFVPRLLAFPFWLVVEFMGLFMPRTILNTGSAKLVIVFVMSLVLGSFAWIAVGYRLFVGMGS